MVDADGLSLTQRERRRNTNDRRALNATMTVLSEQGWSNLSVRAIARQADVSEQMIRSRSTDSANLALWFWREQGNAALQSHVTQLLDTLSLQDDTPPPDPDAAAACFAPFVHPAPTLEAAMELLLVANFDERIRRAVTEDFGAFLTPWIQPRRDPVAVALAAQRAYAIARALGLAVLSRLDGVTPDAFEGVGHAFASVLKRTPPPRPIPRSKANHLDDWFPFDTGDARKDALLRACYDTVAHEGLERTTLAKMVARAGLDVNYVYRTFSRKTDVFIEASACQRAPSIAANQRFRTRVAAKHGDAVAEAVLIREVMRPGREALRTVDAEQARLALRDPDMREAFMQETHAIQRQIAEANPDVEPDIIRAVVLAGRATGFGFALLAMLQPDTWRLPFVSITDAFHQG